MIESHDEGSAGDKARLLDQGERGRRVRGAVQRVWARLERGDTAPKAAGQGPSERGYRPSNHASMPYYTSRSAMHRKSPLQIRGNRPRSERERPKAAARLSILCRTAASPDQPFVHRAAFWAIEGRQCGQSAISLQLRQCLVCTYDLLPVYDRHSSISSSKYLSR